MTREISGTYIYCVLCTLYIIHIITELGEGKGKESKEKVDEREEKKWSLFAQSSNRQQMQRSVAGQSQQRKWKLTDKEKAKEKVKEKEGGEKMLIYPRKFGYSCRAIDFLPWPLFFFLLYHLNFYTLFVVSVRIIHIY